MIDLSITIRKKNYNDEEGWQSEVLYLPLVSRSMMQFIPVLLSLGPLFMAKGYLPRHQRVYHVIFLPSLLGLSRFLSERKKNATWT